MISVIEIKRGAFVNEKDIVKEAMKTLGWNQTQLAEATGIKHSPQ